METQVRVLGWYRARHRQAAGSGRGEPGALRPGVKLRDAAAERFWFGDER